MLEKSCTKERRELNIFKETTNDGRDTEIEG